MERTNLATSEPAAMKAASASHMTGVSATAVVSTAGWKVIPETLELRERIKRAAADYLAHTDRSKALTRSQLQQWAQDLLQRLGLGEQYLGFAAVCLSNEFWREQLMAIDFSKRLLLLPHCLKHAEGCPAEYNEFGLDCRKCGACSIADFKTRAEDLGYKVLVAEGTPIVLKIILSGQVDGIVGVACLNVLEKALDKVLQVQVPALAVPLLSSNCKNTSVDVHWVQEVIGLRAAPPAVHTRSYLPLLRAANELFNGQLEQLAPRLRTTALPQDPIALTESLAYDWLRQGGKRFRPFITLAAYDALQGAPATRSQAIASFPDHVRRIALAIEVFHKASLVHDDIEDNDSYRYGRETLHRRYGIATAINVGDYLIGLGYRLAARCRTEMDAAACNDILHKLAEAHMKLSEGQGAELAWRDATDKALTPLDALKIYALKTAPAFEAALYAGVRLAGPVSNYEKPIAEFCRHLGVAFQILNDLQDWDGDDDNKLIAGQDILSGRPTVILALALELLPEHQRRWLLQLLRPNQLNVERLETLRRLFDELGVFRRAEQLVEKHRARAEAVADEIQPDTLRELLYYLVDNILVRRRRESSASDADTEISTAPSKLRVGLTVVANHTVP
ncbi:MAG: polyprenyl synthetase family protein [Gemmatales bacterium]|nr:polyprenyl synthetase family protein [Gemmatales bacterium]MDW7994956.1 polyprenyl synthetase family protein [Gemmatales bacterium]